MPKQWEDIRREKQAEKIVMLEAELAERNQAYGDLVKQLEHSSNTWQAEVERLRRDPDFGLVGALAGLMVFFMLSGIAAAGVWMIGRAVCA